MDDLPRHSDTDVTKPSTRAALLRPTEFRVQREVTTFVFPAAPHPLSPGDGKPHRVVLVRFGQVTIKINSRRPNRAELSGVTLNTRKMFAAELAVRGGKLRTAPRSEAIAPATSNQPAW